MTTQLAADDYKTSINSGIETIFKNCMASAPSHHVALLLQRSMIVALRGGKRFRPELLRLTLLGYGGRSGKSLHELAIALELYHQSLLIHDDIVDDDYLRYGGPNVLGLYQKEYKTGSSIPLAMALLSGNILFATAAQTVHKLRKVASVHKLLDELYRTQHCVHYGQQLDILNVYSLSNLPTLEDLLLIHELKTASYTVRLPMVWAAIIAKVNKVEMRAIEDFAATFGVLYQLADDHADYFGVNQGMQARPKFRDFQQGKLTHPIVHALQLANPIEQEILTRYIGKITPDQICVQEIVPILCSSGAKHASQQLIRKYRLLSTLALDKLSLSSAAKAELTSLLNRYGGFGAEASNELQVF